jgi:hypothetical protein
MYKLAIAILTVLSTMATSQGELLVYDGFEECEAGKSISAQGAGTGFANKWYSSDGASGTVVEGLTMGDLAVAGQAVSIERADEHNQLRYVHRELKVGKDSGELWMSYLAKWTEDNGGKGHSLNVGIGTLSHQDDSDLKLHTKVLTVNDDNKFAIGYSDEAHETTQASNTPNKLYLVVARWTDIGGTGEATLWLFDSADAVNKVLGSEAPDVLDKNAAEKITVKASGAAAFGTGDNLKLGGFIGGDPGAYKVTVDEIRLADSQKDVLPRKQ